MIFPWYSVMVEHEWKWDNRNIVEVYVRHRYSKLEVFPYYPVYSHIFHDTPIIFMYIYIYTYVQYTYKYPMSDTIPIARATVLLAAQKSDHLWLRPFAHISCCGLGGVGVIKFFVSCTPTWCHAMRSSLALAHRHDAALSDLLLHLHTDMTPRYQIFSCTCTPTWCHAIWDLLLHLHTDMMPRY